MKELQKRKQLRTFYLLFFAAVSAVYLSLSLIQVHAQSRINVRYHTQDQIRKYIADKRATVDDALSFLNSPFMEYPYSEGNLTNAVQQSAVNMLNQIRYIAGVSDNVTISDKYCEYAQAAAFLSYLNGQVSNKMEKPYNMSNDLYLKALDGIEKSNLSYSAWAARSLNETMVSTWMGEADSLNMSTVGHRRWLLNPQMGQTGFGAVSGLGGTYSSVYVADRTNYTANETGVAWPARNMPIEYFSDNYPWSFSLGQAVDAANIHVTLTRLTDYRTWQFSNAYSDGEFFVDNSSYGQTGCIIFRPKLQANEQYKVGDSFQVTISGAGDPITYTVQFFHLDLLKITYTVFFDSQGGSDVAPFVLGEMGKISPIPVPVKQNAEFLGWYTQPNGQGMKLTDMTVINQNVTFYANWGAKDTLTGLSVSYTGRKQAGENIADGLIVNANYTDGTSRRVYDYTLSQRTLSTGINMVSVVYQGIKKSILITVDGTSGGNRIPEESTAYYELFFHPNGGTNLSYQKITISVGDVLDELPTVQRANYRFKGWYTKPSGGTRIGRTSLPESECVLYAQWIRVTKPSKAYAPSLKVQKNGQLYIRWNEVNGAKGYEISYSTSKKFAASSTKKTTSSYAVKTLQNLKRGTVYYVRIRAYKTDSMGNKIYGAYSAVRKITM